MSMEYSSEESESEHEELESDRSAVSLMDRLRTPMPAADIARSRKVMKNDSPKVNIDARVGMLLTLRAVISKTAVYKTMSKHL